MLLLIYQNSSGKAKVMDISNSIVKLVTMKYFCKQSCFSSRVESFWIRNSETDKYAQQVQVVLSFVRYCKKNIPPKPIVLPVWYGYFWGPTRIKHHVSRAILKIWHFYWGENRVKLSPLFLTSETRFRVWVYFWESWALSEHHWHNASPY